MGHTSKVLILCFLLALFSFQGCGSKEKNEAFHELFRSCKGTIEVNYHIGSWSDDTNISCKEDREKLPFIK